MFQKIENKQHEYTIHDNTHDYLPLSTFSM